MAEPFSSGITAPIDWINGILPMLPGATVDWIKHEVLIKARTFFELSGAWRDWIGPIELDPTTPFYSPELTDYKAEMVAILDAYRVSDGVSLNLVVNHSSAVDQEIKSGEKNLPKYIYRTPEGLLSIFPVVPDTVIEQVMVLVTMKPIDLCMPDWIRSRYFDAIRCGVLGAAYLMPGVNYKPDLGARMERRFRALIGRATWDAISSGTALPQRVPVPQQVVGSQRGRFASVAVSGTRW